MISPNELNVVVALAKQRRLLCWIDDFERFFLPALALVLVLLFQPDVHSHVAHLHVVPELFLSSAHFPLHHRHAHVVHALLAHDLTTSPLHFCSYYFCSISASLNNIFTRSFAYSSLGLREVADLLPLLIPLRHI